MKQMKAEVFNELNESTIKYLEGKRVKHALVAELDANGRPLEFYSC